MINPIRKGFIMKKNNSFRYPKIFSDLRPVPHCAELPISKPKIYFVNYSDDNEECIESVDGVPSRSQFHGHSDEEYIKPSSSAVHKIISKGQKRSCS